MCNKVNLFINIIDSSLENLTLQHRASHETGGGLEQIWGPVPLTSA